MSKRVSAVGVWLAACLGLALVGCDRQGTAERDAAGTMGAGAASAGPQGSAAGGPTNVAQSALALPSLEGTLTGIYDTVNPSVVNIQVMKKAPRRETEFPFGDMPGFRFFGPPGQEGGDGPPERGQRGRRQPPEEQFQSGSGSGFVWDSGGHIVTNNHVVTGADKIRVNFSDGTTVPAKMVGADPDSDLAVLQVSMPADRLPVVKIADSTQLKVGQLAVAIGNPFGLEGTMTVGYISALGRLLPVDVETPGAAYTIPDVIQTDAPINPGNSGGVLMNSAGEVIGVTSAIISPAGANAGIGFAIPSAIVKRVVPDLITKGRYEHTWLGISGGTLSPDMAKAMKLPDGQRGALVADVIANSPADKAGLRGSDRQVVIDGEEIKVGGDVVIEFEGQPVKRFDDIVAYLARQTKVGQTVNLKVLRGGQETAVKVTLLARPSSGQQPAKAVANDGTGPGAWLGIVGDTLDGVLAKAMKLPPTTKGVLISQVENGSPADLAGLRGSTKLLDLNGEQVQVGGDVIVAADGQPIASIEDLESRLNGARPGAKLRLDVLRDGAKQTVNVTLGKLPE